MPERFNAVWFNSLNRALVDTGVVEGGKGLEEEDGCAEARIV